MLREKWGGRYRRLEITGVVAVYILSTASLIAFATDDTVKSESDDVVKVREQRLFDSVKYLASDELEGRGVGTKGLDLAAEFIAEQFSNAGLNTKLFGDKPYQFFQRRGKYALGSKNQIRLIGRDSRIEPELGEDYSPLSWSQTGQIDVPLAFVGYGISAPEWKYDDYAGIDVKGHCVIVLRNEPEWVPKSKSDDDDKSTDAVSDHAYLFRKIENAIDHGAVAVIFCTDKNHVGSELQERRERWESTIDRLMIAESAWRERMKQQKNKVSPEEWTSHLKELQPLIDAVVKAGTDHQTSVDPLLDLQTSSSSFADRSIPVLHCKRALVNRIVDASLSRSLDDLEQHIVDSHKPSSHLFDDWKITGEVSVTWNGSELKNVAGMIGGTGAKSDETIIVGAHYDHLGRGGWGSLEFTSPNEIHNGADDNASGTAVLMEVARLLSERAKKQPLLRQVLFLAFTAEEQGLVGSEYYVRHPLIPLEETVAMLNLDMVGRLRNDHLTVYGTGTAPEFGEYLLPLERDYGFRFTRKKDGYGPSDHASFYSRRVPVLHFFTGFHPEYHRPADDYDKLNIAGMRRIAEMVADLAIKIAERDNRPTYNITSESFSITSLLPSGTGSRRTTSRSSNRDTVYLGVFCEPNAEENGLKVKQVVAEGPAEKAGLREGDLIQRLNDQRVNSHQELANRVKKLKSGDEISLHVLRGSLELDIMVTLETR
ncbi:MAG: M28 family peptidase [Planctomycetota bacterium]|nr:M28 family peptidase [Planctomycetota bacterium]MDA1211932.1 M28 family peptidase [Planctomycetota bacterium]